MQNRTHTTHNPGGCLVPSAVEGPDGVAPSDRLTAELGRRLKDRCPAAVTDPATVAEIRRAVARQAAQEVRRAALTSWWRPAGGAVLVVGVAR